MLALDVSYTSKGRTITGPDQIAAKTIEELFDWVQGNTVLLAKDFLEQEQKESDFPKKEYLTLVDGKIGAKEESVKVFGKIEYVTKLENVTDVVIDILKFVNERSPTRSGYYTSRHVLMYNGKVVARGAFNGISWLKAPRDYKDTDKFRVINLSPYARKLERFGKKKGTQGSKKGRKNDKERLGKSKSGNDVRAPNGAYWLAKNTARRRYPQLKNNIKFSFIPVAPNIAAGQNSKTFSPNDYKFKTGRGKGRSYLYPSITVTIAPSSFTSNAGFTESGGKL